ncbi:MAG: hypothetical protein AB9856_16795 [Cellulosilyticaceae bacterium]
MRKKNTQKQQGNAVFFTMILILAMMVLVTAAVKVSSTTVQTSDLERNTNNAYALAQSGIEKINDSITKYIEANSEAITKDVDSAIRTLIFSDTEQPKYAYLNYVVESDYNTRLIVKPEVQHYYLRKITFERVRDFLEDQYSTEKNTLYIGKSDNKLSDTKVTVLSSAVEESIEKDPASYWGKNVEEGIGFVKNEWFDKALFTVVVKAEGGNGEVACVEGSINLQQPKGNAETEVIDRYQWVNKPALILDSSIVCFSDFVVQNGAKVTIEGDLSVKGTSQAPYKNGKINIVDADQNGGVIVANGGKLTCTGPKDSKSHNTGGIYTMNNVMVTNGWLKPGTEVTNQYEANTSITATGDIVADNVVVADDFYMKASNDKTDPKETETDSENQMPWYDKRKVKNTTIKTEANIFVDNDVRIDRYVSLGSVKAPYIEVRGSIFGISDGEMRFSESGNLDPNKSSGVFNLSEKNADGESPIISAYGMYVNGQPYITFDGEEVENKQYYKLYESIGEPFQDVFGFAVGNEYPYQMGDSKGNPGYLKDSFYQGRMNKDCIKIKGILESNNEEKAYAPYTITANGKSYGDSNGEVLPSIVHQYFKSGNTINQSQATNIFYRKPQIGDAKLTFEISKLTGAQPLGTDYNGIIQNPIDYYNGNYGQNGKMKLDFMGHYKKYYTAPKDSTVTLGSNLLRYHGIQAFMTAIREVFYGEFGEKPKGSGKLEASYTGFQDYVKNTGFENAEWSYNEPIDVIPVSTEGPKTIDIGNYYYGNTPVPTVLYIRGENSKTILTGKNKKFRGLIVCEGDLEVKESMEIEGSVIVQGSANKGDGINGLIRPTVVTGEQAGIYIGTSGSHVKFIHNPNVLWELKFASQKNMRYVLDLLGITKYNQVTDGVGDAFISKDYTQNQIQLSQKSTFIHREGMLKGKIKMMKKID